MTASIPETSAQAPLAPAWEVAKPKTVRKAYLLLILLGATGAHYFYLNNRVKGFTTLVVCAAALLTLLFTQPFGLGFVCGWLIADALSIRSEVRKANIANGVISR